MHQVRVDDGVSNHRHLILPPETFVKVCADVAVLQQRCTTSKVSIVLMVFCQMLSLPFISPQVPLLPFVPVISMFVNVYLMMQLDRGTWLRFAIWMFLGTDSLKCAQCFHTEPMSLH